MDAGSSSSSYEILLKLAEGGMAEIFLARSVTGAGVERIVVLKRVLRNAAQDEQLVRLFIDEGRLAAQLQHPNVVQVYDVGKLGGSYFISMEYVHGETLRDLLLLARHQGVKLPIATVMTIAAGAAAGLHHAHDRRGTNGKSLNIVHADVSPSNLMITREGVVKIVDFGIAKAAHTLESDRTVQGKLCYMSPEQVRSQPLDRRSDLFSLGIVLWELLTLQGLFRADSDFNVMDAIINQPSPAPSQYRLDVPREIDEIVLRLLAKDPRNRYQSASDLVDAIEIAAMRMSTLLSTASVARQLKEWFGVKPEPWFEQSTNGTFRRVVVDAEPVPRDLSMTIAGPINPVDDILDTMRPANVRATSIAGAAGWDNPTVEDLESFRDRLFQAARERKTPNPVATPPHGIVVESRKARDDATPPPAPAPPPATWQQPADQASQAAPRNQVPPPSSPQTEITDQLRTKPPNPRTPTAPPPASSWRRQENTRSPVPMILMGVLLTVGIGAGGFALLYKTQLKGQAPRKDAGASVAGSAAPPVAPPKQATPDAAAQPDAEPAPAAVVEPPQAEPAKAEAIEPPVSPPAPAAAEPKPATAPAHPAEKPAKSLDELFAAKNYAEAIGVCLSQAPTKAQRVACAVSACGVHDAPHAKRWLDTSPVATRSSTIQQCRTLGVFLQPPPDKAGDCADDPDSCL